jgi:hypothetical protein
MTVQFKVEWNGYDAGGVYTLSAPEEARLIAAGIAFNYVPVSQVAAGLTSAQIAAGAVAPAAVSSTGSILGADGAPVSGAYRDQRRAAWPMSLPSVMASPPTITLGVADAATQIPGSVIVSCIDRAAFSYVNQFPKLAGGPCILIGSAYTGKTSKSSGFVDFRLDTLDPQGRFEIRTQGAGIPSGDIRIAIRNRVSKQWEYTHDVKSISRSAIGGIFLDLVTLGAPGIYDIRLEMNSTGKFYGVRVGPTDQVTALPTPEKTFVVIGDSFNDPTFSDPGGQAGFNYNDSWITGLHYMTGMEFISAGCGGTGWMNPNAAIGGTATTWDILQDVLAVIAESKKKVDGIIFTSGLNDFGYVGGTAGYPAATPAGCAAEVVRCINACKAAGITENYIQSPFFPRGSESFPQIFMQFPLAIKAAAASLGVPYLDILDSGPPLYLASSAWTGTLAADVASNAQFFYTATLPSYFSSLPNGDPWFVRIGSGAQIVTKKVVYIETNATYGYKCYINAGGSWGNTMGYAFTAGAPIELCGTSYHSGTGFGGGNTVACSISIASPAVITANNAFLAGTNQPVIFATDGALPTGITAGTVYYVRGTGLTSTSFQISGSPGGGAINTSGTQSGTHSVYAGVKDGTADRGTGPDSTHATRSGHRNIATASARRLAQAMDAR